MSDTAIGNFYLNGHPLEARHAAEHTESKKSLSA